MIWITLLTGAGLPAAGAFLVLLARWGLGGDKPGDGEAGLFAAVCAVLSLAALAAAIVAMWLVVPWLPRA